MIARTRSVYDAVAVFAQHHDRKINSLRVRYGGNRGGRIISESGESVGVEDHVAASLEAVLRLDALELFVDELLNAHVVFVQVA